MRVTCAIIIREQNEVLIARRPLQKKQGGKWEFPGGKIDDNESAEQCIAREILEELDVEIRIVRQIPSFVHKYELFEIELIPFICVLSSGNIRLNEHIDSQWVYFEDLVTFDLCEADKRLVRVLDKIKELE